MQHQIEKDEPMKKFVLSVLIIQLGICIGACAVLADEMKTATFNDWTVELPAGWSGDDEMGLYWPGEIEQFMGRPPVSLHMGGIPVMSEITFEERVTQHVNAKPIDKKDATVEGLKGFTCIWEVNGKKHYGMFLEENVGGAMRLIYFFEFQAPIADYPEFEEVFEKAVATAKN